MSEEHNEAANTPTHGPVHTVDNTDQQFKHKGQTGIVHTENKADTSSTTPATYNILNKNKFYKLAKAVNLVHHMTLIKKKANRSPFIKRIAKRRRIPQTATADERISEETVHF